MTGQVACSNAYLAHCPPSPIVVDAGVRLPRRRCRHDAMTRAILGPIISALTSTEKECANGTLVFTVGGLKPQVFARDVAVGV